MHNLSGLLGGRQYPSRPLVARATQASKGRSAQWQRVAMNARGRRCRAPLIQVWPQKIYMEEPGCPRCRTESFLVNDNNFKMLTFCTSVLAAALGAGCVRAQDSARLADYVGWSVPVAGPLWTPRGPLVDPCVDPLWTPCGLLVDTSVYAAIGSYSTPLTVLSQLTKLSKTGNCSSSSADLR